MFENSGSVFLDAWDRNLLFIQNDVDCIDITNLASVCDGILLAVSQSSDEGASTDLESRDIEWDYNCVCGNHSSIVNGGYRHSNYCLSDSEIDSANGASISFNAGLSNQILQFMVMI